MCSITLLTSEDGLSAFELRSTRRSPMPCTFQRNYMLNVQRLMLDNVYKDYVQECWYLEFLLHRRLNWSNYCEAMRDKALMSLGRLIPLLKSPLPVSSQLLLYSSYVRPTYVRPTPLHPKINDPQVVQNRALTDIPVLIYISNLNFSSLKAI